MGRRVQGEGQGVARRVEGLGVARRVETRTEREERWRNIISLSV